MIYKPTKLKKNAERPVNILIVRRSIVKGKERWLNWDWPLDAPIHEMGSSQGNASQNTGEAQKGMMTQKPNKKQDDASYSPLHGCNATVFFKVTIKGKWSNKYAGKDQYYIKGMVVGQSGTTDQSKWEHKRHTEAVDGTNAWGNHTQQIQIQMKVFMHVVLLEGQIYH